MAGDAEACIARMEIEPRRAAMSRVAGVLMRTSNVYASRRSASASDSTVVRVSNAVANRWSWTTGSGS